MNSARISAPIFETRPLYLQVHGKLMHFIVNGSWRPGDMIPNEVDLARDFGVSVGTMRKALQTLTEQGLLTRRQGRGTFVAQPQTAEFVPLDNLRTSGEQALQWAIASKELIVGEATATESSALEIETGTRIIRLRRILIDADTSSALLEYCALPEFLFPDLAAEKAAHGLPISQLARRFGLLIGSSSERISIFPADNDKAGYLNTKPGMPLLRMERVASSFDKMPVEFRIAYCRLGAGVRYSNRMK